MVQETAKYFFSAIYKAIQKIYQLQAPSPLPIVL